VKVSCVQSGPAGFTAVVDADTYGSDRVSEQRSAKASLEYRSRAWQHVDWRRCASFDLLGAGWWDGGGLSVVLLEILSWLASRLSQSPACWPMGRWCMLFTGERQH
jgi:hypothetical protein